MGDEQVDIGALLEDREAVDRALQKAVRDAVRRHKLLGNPVAVWRDGSVLWIPPEQIEVEDEDER